ncbi:hypothetical protein D3C73_778510 [compost metagenome]
MILLRSSSVILLVTKPKIRFETSSIRTKKRTDSDLGFNSSLFDFAQKPFVKWSFSGVDNSAIAPYPQW